MWQRFIHLDFRDEARFARITSGSGTTTPYSPNAFIREPVESAMGGRHEWHLCDIDSIQTPRPRIISAMTRWLARLKRERGGDEIFLLRLKLRCRRCIKKLKVKSLTARNVGKVRASGAGLRGSNNGILPTTDPFPLLAPPIMPSTLLRSC